MNALRSASGHPVSHVAYSPDGATFAAAQPHSGVTLHDRITGQPIRTAGTDRVASYRGLVYFADGTRIAASTPKGLEVFDVPDLAFEYHHRLARNAYLAGIGASLMTAWPAKVERIEITSHGHPPVVVPVWQFSSVEFEGLSPDGQFVVWLARENRLGLGDLRAKRSDVLNHPTLAEAEVPGLRKLPAYPLVRRPPGPERVVFAPRSDRFAVCNGKCVIVFDMPTDEPESDDEESEIPPPHGVLRSVFSLPAPEKWPKDSPWAPPVAFTPNGRNLLVRRPNQQVQMWDVDGGAMLAQWDWQLEGVACLVVAPDGLTAVAGGRFGKVVVWDLE